MPIDVWQLEGQVERRGGEMRVEDMRGKAREKGVGAGKKLESYYGGVERCYWFGRCVTTAQSLLSSFQKRLSPLLFSCAHHH